MCRVIGHTFWMSKNKVVILAATIQNLSVSEVAKRYEVSPSWVYRLLKRYQKVGEAAFEPGSKTALTNPNALDQATKEEIVQLRRELLAKGLDAGAQSISYRLVERHGTAPALSTIWRCLRQHGLVVADPRKKPKAYTMRFEADFPNETWQSDFTHVRLASGKDIEVLNFLDDHSRLLLSCRAHRVVTASRVIADFTDAINQFGPPQSTLTDNGAVFTARFINGRNAFEHLLSALGIRQKNSSPNHPQTQGKIERFHQTLKRWLAAREPARNIAELQKLLDEFRTVYNKERPHRALDGKTPWFAYTAKPKLRPSKKGHIGDWRVRYDRVDKFGKLTLRLGGNLHHLGIGKQNSGLEVILLIDLKQVTVVHQESGEILSEHAIEPLKNYWPKQEGPGSKSGASVMKVRGQK